MTRAILLSFYTLQLCILLTTAQPTKAHQVFCSEALYKSPKPKISQELGSVRVDQVAVTGESRYPVESVLKNLEITSTMMTVWEIEQKSVLSIAEGMSLLVPTLLAKDVKATGMDLWYNQEFSFPPNAAGKEMQDYLTKYKQHLVQGNARQLENGNESVDVILSHMLVNNQHIADTLEVMTEIIRVLKVGGEARIYGFSKERAQTTLNYLAKNFPSEVQNLIFESGLMIYRKTDHVVWPKKIHNPWDRDTAYMGRGGLNGPLGDPIFGR